MKNLLKLFCLLLIVSCKSQTSEEKEVATLLKQAPYNELSNEINKNEKVDSLYFKRGMQLTQNKQYLVAIKDFEKAWSLNENQDNGVFLGAAYINAQKYQEAILHLSSVIKKYPKNLMARERLAFCYEQTAKFEEAIALYNSILEQDPDDFVTMATKAYALQQLNKDDEAMQWFERSYKIMPNKTIGNELAIMYAETKNPNTVSFCDNVIKLDSAGEKNVQVIYAKARYYKNINNYNAALPLLNQCIQTDYNFAYAYLDKSIILYEQKNYTEAVKLLEILKQIDNQNAEVYYRMGLCYQANGKKQEALLEYERALALDKNYADAQSALSSLKATL